MQIQQLLPLVRQLHNQLRDAVVMTCEKSSLENLSTVEYEGADDTIYSIDAVCERELIEIGSKEIALHVPIVLIAEGLKNGKMVLPEGAKESEAKYRMIVDPIDGTRGLMYQKRSAWILTGIAPNRGEDTSLQDIQLAVQTEIPLVKQHLSDQLWAIRGNGMHAIRHNRLTKTEHTIELKPSRATTIAHGFAMLSRFFPGARDIIAEIDEKIIHEALGPVQPGKAHCFEDQYISTGGQFYELMAGHDRFNADIRPLLNKMMHSLSRTPGITSHPYDACTELIAREMGILITDEKGELLNPKLNVTDEVTWIGYANQAIHEQMEPILLQALRAKILIC